MLIISSFEHSLHLELALKELEEIGLKKEKILAVPLNSNISQEKLLDTIDRSGGIMLFDWAAMLGTIFSIFGVIYGFVLAWGPIIWGLLGFIIGGIIGFALELFNNRRKMKRKKLKNGKNSEVIIIVECEENQENRVKETLARNNAIGIGSFRN